jgi:hypothetical protein
MFAVPSDLQKIFEENLRKREVQKEPARVAIY